MGASKPQPMPKKVGEKQSRFNHLGVDTPVHHHVHLYRIPAHYSSASPRIAPGSGSGRCDTNTAIPAGNPKDSAHCPRSDSGRCGCARISRTTALNLRALSLRDLPFTPRSPLGAQLAVNPRSPSTRTPHQPALAIHYAVSPSPAWPPRYRGRSSEARCRRCPERRRLRWPGPTVRSSCCPRQVLLLPEV